MLTAGMGTTDTALIRQA